MFSRILTSGMIGGALAGLIAGVLQLIFLQPVLLHAELFEAGLLVHFSGDAPSDAVVALPGFDLMRDGLSLLFSMLIYAGYGLVLVALMSMAEEHGAEINARTGLVWGVAGFVTVHLAPGFSLPPEVPGVASVDVGSRQVWWFVTVGATAIGLWCLAFVPTIGAAIAAVLILGPHIVGAPQPAVLTGPAPTEIGALFAARAFGVGLIAWALVGSFSGWLWAAEATEVEQS